MLEAVKKFLREYRWTIGLSLAVVLGTGVIEWMFGRSLLGPDGRFGWWEGSVWSAENSQRVADAYSFSHIIHGMLFYGLLFLVARKLPLRHRLVIALLLEAGWELLENSPIIIDRYRAVTISLGYVGDSVLNSVADVLMAGIGFFVAWSARLWVSVVIILVFEIGCLFWVRDNLTLNVIMLVAPSETIKVWQSEGHEDIIAPPAPEHLELKVE